MHYPLSAKTLRLSILLLGLLLSACAPDDGGESGDTANAKDFNAVPGVTSVVLSWSGVEGASSYVLERKQGSGSFEPIDDFIDGSDTTVTDDKALKPSTEYTYKLITVKGGSKSSGATKSVTTLSQGNPTSLTALLPVWQSKQAVAFPANGNGEVAAVTNATKNVSITGTNVEFTGSGEAMFHIGGLCTQFTATATGSGSFKVFADELEIANSNGGDITADIPGSTSKQNLSLVFKGTGAATLAKPTIYCQSTPTQPEDVYLTGRWGEKFLWGNGQIDQNPDAPGQFNKYGYIVPTHAANLPDGSIVTWSAWKETTYGIKFEGFYNQTAGFTWNPKGGTGANSFTETNNPTHDMFCAGLAVMLDGDILAAGGGSQSTGLDSQTRTSYFDSATKAWAEVRPGGKDALAVKHWYGTSVALPDGRVLHVGGASAGTYLKSAEVRGTTQDSPWVISAKSAISPMYPNTADINISTTPVGTGTANSTELGEVQAWYPYLNVAPNGQLFQSGPIPRFYKYNVNADNSVVVDSAQTARGTAPAGTAQMRTWGNSIMYDEGKLLVTGGSVIRGAGATNTGILLDINDPNAIKAEAAPPMRFRRSHHNSVVLPTGDVLIMGGNNSGKQFTDGVGIVDGQTVKFTEAKREVAEGSTLGQDPNANYQWPTDIETESALIPELYSPDKNSWRDVASMTVPRNYHSVGILLQDGRVLAAGGGLCGDQGGVVTGVPCNHPDGQIFEPPYLFKPNGDPALRPTIGNVSLSKNADGYPAMTISGKKSATFNITISNLGEGTQISKFSMIKLSAVTHSINTDLRYVEYTAGKGLTGSGKDYQITTTDNINVLTPGYYFLFAINDKGVPSEGVVVQVN
ncbi:MAG: galactose oxidase-like domain-containing protein [Trueperaceae bacterium]